MSVTIGLDIGGTKLVVAAASESGEILRRRRTPTPHGLEEGLSLIAAMVDEVCDGETIAGIGAAIGGPLDWETGVVSPLHQPKWREVPLKQWAEERWGCSFAVDVDTNVAALGEFHHGGARSPRFLYLTLSTGMGGGFLIDGEIYRAADGLHPEVGHQSIPWRCSHPERIQCECGSPDCLEAIVSGNGIRRIYRKPAEELNDEEWQEVAHNLGLGLRNLAAIYLPDLIVVGGGVALGGGQVFLHQAEETMRAHLKIVRAPTLRLSTLGPDSPLIGAITLALIR